MNGLQKEDCSPARWELRLCGLSAISGVSDLSWFQLGL
jgi:hypothetical protein